MATPVIERLPTQPGAPYAKCQCVLCGTVFNAAADALNPPCPNASKHVEPKVTIYQLLKTSRETLADTYRALAARNNPDDAALLMGLREALSQFSFSDPVNPR